MNEGRQRELRDEYKQNGPAMGVFCVRHLSSGAVLLGSSNNVSGTLNRHQFELKSGMHRNKALQHDWNIDGASGFEFGILDTLKPRDESGGNYTDELALLLQMWREQVVGDRARYA